MALQLDSVSVNIWFVDVTALMEVLPPEQAKRPKGRPHGHCPLAKTGIEAIKDRLRRLKMEEYVRCLIYVPSPRHKGGKIYT